MQPCARESKIQRRQNNGATLFLFPMAAPPSASTTAAEGRPAPPPHRARPPPTQAPLSNPKPRGGFSPRFVVLTGVAMTLVAITGLTLFGCIAIGSDYPTLKVAALSVSNLTANASGGATWKAAFLAEKQLGFGDFSFREVHCFIYYNWDPRQPLAAASVEPFELRGVGRTVIQATMKMERAEAVEDIDRERRSVGTAAVGLGLKMRGRYVFKGLWKKSYGSIEAYCDNLKVAFANSTTEGTLVTGGNTVTGDTPPSDGIPSCSYDDVD
ncbi:hypothetical protein BT93_L2317 [Corymbia citriodora subsp. variegata]|uniref:Late embryogenesis abundant protein LEA-2 subgroup domain-containing protein n=1 Tax=Corymbia citriodora subsp. variegata TaxID=360336 RepID=A0A8T0CPF8_CORYI|nr:hypothetical protein BT93_L2317 [Corymbia citriodora subsp. variegata]